MPPLLLLLSLLLLLLPMNHWEHTKCHLQWHGQPATAAAAANVQVGMARWMPHGAAWVTWHMSTC
jgi:hypothetical protein